MRRAKSWCWCLGLSSLLVAPSLSWAQAQQLPIGDFVDAQLAATYVVWCEPEGTVNPRCLYLDAFGKRAGALGLVDFLPEITGRLTIRALADGRAHVSALLHSRNALCWGRQGGVLAFGATPASVAGGAVPALGDAITQFEFLMPSVGSDLPDFFTELGSEKYPILSLKTAADCRGELKAGSGYPAGMPGFAHTTQQALSATGVRSGCPAEDCWPVELVSFKPVGK